MARPPILLFLGGSRPIEDPTDLDQPNHRIPPGSIVVAADSGFERARAAGLRVDHLVGDLDSVDPAAIAESPATRVHRHPTDKDATDAELAIDLARTLHDPATRGDLIVFGDTGGRLDHLLADIALLASPATRGFRVRAHLGEATVTVVRPDAEVRIDGRTRDLVSLLAYGGPVSGTTTTGLRWPLVDATLTPGTTRGVSNELIADRASIAVESGVLVVVQPGHPSRADRDRTAPYDPSPR